MEITKRRLLSLLERYDDDQPVRIMTQQNYPLQLGILGVTSTLDLIKDSQENDDNTDTASISEGDVCCCDQPIGSHKRYLECETCGGFLRLSTFKIPNDKDVVYLVTTESSPDRDDRTVAEMPG